MEFPRIPFACHSERSEESPAPNWRFFADGFAEFILRNEGLTTWFTLSLPKGSE
jgi:hypothetical protein